MTASTVDPNPLLRAAERPAYDEIRPAHVTPAIGQLLADAEAALERAVGPDVPADYETLSRVLEVPLERLNTAWGMVSHLQSVADTPELREAQGANLPRIIEFSTRLGADERLFAKYKAVAAAQREQLTPARRKALDDALREFVLGGAELRGAARERHAAIKARAGELSQRFGENVLDATDRFALWCSEAELEGVPSDVVQAAREAAAAEGREGCKLTLRFPCYGPVLAFARDRSIRERMYRAYNTRCSELAAPELDNTALIAELLVLRQEDAELLGYGSFAQSALVSKMARSPAEVTTFVRDLVRRARPHAERELTELGEFAASTLGLRELQAWDRNYVAEQLKQARYAFSSEALRQYFTAPRVLDGLFRLVETLFGVTIREDEAPRWHDSVRFYRVWRGDHAVAAFYLDTEARNGKQGGAWMGSVRTRWQRPDGELQLPVAHLVCNFAPPVGDKPSLLTHDDVVTLFHEFGHGLHHMLTQAVDLPVSGISGVEHDAVELPSQFMENFCWEWEVLQRLTAHVDTGEPLPRELFDSMHRARHFLSALGLLRQCEYALYDIRVHDEPGAGTRSAAVADEVMTEVQPEPWPAFSRMPNAFSHLFDGGYAAGYYGYAWARVLAADAYAAFEEDGVFSTRTGERFREQILEVGGTRPAMESFTAFRGRAPRIDALLRHMGLDAPVEAGAT